MAYTLVLAVGFGSTKIGLTTVGYQLKNADGTNNGTRVSGASIKEIGSGYYQTSVSIPDGHTGGILWDTGEGTPKYAYQEINPNTGEYVDARVTTRASQTSLNAIPTNPTLQTVWTDTKAGYLDVAVSSMAVGMGTGINTVTITLTETGGTPKIVGATVSVKNQAGDTLLATGTTNSNGQVQFMLDNGTYSVYKQKLGSHSFTNPETLVVSGNTNQSYIGTPISMSAPAQPNTSRMFIWARNPDGTLMTALTGNIKIAALPYKYSGAAHKGDEISFTKHADGYWYVDVVYGATVDIYIPALGIKVNTTVPSQTTKDIGGLL